MLAEITDADEISRCIIFDRAFDHELHIDALLWRFESKDEAGIYHESAVLRRLAPLPDDVHRVGCGIAAQQNERKKQPPPGPTRRYYCGFRTASVASLPTDGEGFEVLLSNIPEGGEESHVDVALIVTVDGKSARANCRTNAGLALAEHFGPPAPHCCECDDQDEHHPLALWGEECLFGGLQDRWPAVLFPTDDDLQILNGEVDQPDLLQ